PELEQQRLGDLGLDADDPHRPIKAFLIENTALFGHGAGVLTNATIKREFVTPHNGMRTVIWQQQLDGILVFEGRLVGHITCKGELVNISSHFVPDIAGASGMGATQRAALKTEPLVSPQQAVVNAAKTIGETLRVEEVGVSNRPEQNQGEWRSFTAEQLIGEAHARLVWLPMNRNSIRLCWSFLLNGGTRGELFRVLIDARTGETLVRQCLTTYQHEPAFYRAFTSDSPSPFSPGHPAPSSVQPARRHNALRLGRNDSAIHQQHLCIRCLDGPEYDAESREGHGRATGSRNELYVRWRRASGRPGESIPGELLDS
ncbi:MAG: hypothetical protein K9N48_03185, partial [Verrucomicrobia bacterium]|nr:hypothetical protein [Verrucomicrobiota bacterium]